MTASMAKMRRTHLSCPSSRRRTWVRTLSHSLARPQGSRFPRRQHPRVQPRARHPPADRAALRNDPDLGPAALAAGVAVRHQAHPARHHPGPLLARHHLRPHGQLPAVPEGVAGEPGQQRYEQDARPGVRAAGHPPAEGVLDARAHRRPVVRLRPAAGPRRGRRGPRAPGELHPRAAAVGRAAAHAGGARLDARGGHPRPGQAPARAPAGRAAARGHLGRQHRLPRRRRQRTPAPRQGRRAQPGPRLRHHRLEGARPPRPARPARDRAQAPPARRCRAADAPAHGDHLRPARRVAVQAVAAPRPALPELLVDRLAGHPAGSVPGRAEPA